MHLKVALRVQENGGIRALQTLILFLLVTVWNLGKTLVVPEREVRVALVTLIKRIFIGAVGNSGTNTRYFIKGLLALGALTQQVLVYTVISPARETNQRVLLETRKASIIAVELVTFVDFRYTFVLR